MVGLLGGGGLCGSVHDLSIHSSGVVPGSFVDGLWSSSEGSEAQKPCEVIVSVRPRRVQDGHRTIPGSYLESFWNRFCIGFGIGFGTVLGPFLEILVSFWCRFWRVSFVLGFLGGFWNLYVLLFGVTLLV